MLSEKTIADQFKDWLPELRAYLIPILKDYHDAEEIASTAFFQTWQHRDQFQSLSDFRAYMFIVGRNTAYRRLYKASRSKKKLSKGDKFSHQSLPIVELHILKLHLDAWMKSAIEQLPDRCRDIFKLLYYHGMKTDEIAVKLNISPLTVKSQRGFAINKLKALAKKSSDIFVHMYSNVYPLSLSSPATSLSRWVA